MAGSLMGTSPSLSRRSAISRMYADGDAGGCARLRGDGLDGGPASGGDIGELDLRGGEDLGEAFCSLEQRIFLGFRRRKSGGASSLLSVL